MCALIMSLTLCHSWFDLSHESVRVVGWRGFPTQDLFHLRINLIHDWYHPCAPICWITRQLSCTLALSERYCSNSYHLVHLLNTMWMWMFCKTSLIVGIDNKLLTLDCSILLKHSRTFHTKSTNGQKQCVTDAFCNETRPNIGRTKAKRTRKKIQRFNWHKRRARVGKGAFSPICSVHSLGWLTPSLLNITAIIIRFDCFYFNHHHHHRHHHHHVAFYALDDSNPTNVGILHNKCVCGPLSFGL